MFSIDEMFANLGRQEKQEAITAFMNLQQSKRTTIREHIMKVIAYLNEAEILGAEIDGDTHISMVMNTLSHSFNQFSVDYELHLKQYTLTSLMKDLQITEVILKKKGITTEANVAEADSSKTKPKVRLRRSMIQNPST